MTRTRYLTSDICFGLYRKARLTQQLHPPAVLRRCRVSLEQLQQNAVAKYPRSRGSLRLLLLARNDYREEI